jgi:hypothetical protein
MERVTGELPFTLEKELAFGHLTNKGVMDAARGMNKIGVESVQVDYLLLWDPGSRGLESRCSLAYISFHNRG